MNLEEEFARVATKPRKLRIKKFDARTIQPHSFIYIIGLRGSGKIPLIRNILSECEHTHDISMAIASLSTHLQQFREFVPHKYVFDDNYHSIFHKAEAAEVLELSCLLIAHRLGPERRSLQNKLTHIASTHKHTTTIYSESYPVRMHEAIRHSIKYVFVTWNNQRAHQERLWKYFFPMFERFEEFQRVYKECTKNGDYLVLAKTTHATNIENTVFYYSVPKYNDG